MEECLLSITAFKQHTNGYMTTPFALPELMKYYQDTGSISFEEAFSMVHSGMTTQETASIFAKVHRDQISDEKESFLEAMRLFCSIESRVRFAIWPKGTDSPHHFSKLLITQKAKHALSESLILTLLAVVADPKGLNLRNVITHGFMANVSLALPILHGLDRTISDLVPDEPLTSFSKEMLLYNFHIKKLFIQSGRYVSSFFSIRDPSFAYFLFDQGRYYEALLFLFPIFEQSLRRAAVAVLDLPPERLMSSTSEHFLSIKECFNALPDDLSNMINDILFIPEGPRIRDNLMHRNCQDIPKEFAALVFDAFERCARFFEKGEIIPYKMCFHPIRIFEYEISPFMSNVPDLFWIYDSHLCSELTESVSLAKTICFPEMGDEFNRKFQIFIAAAAILMMKKKAKQSSLKHLDALVHGAQKCAVLHDRPKFEHIVRERLSLLLKYINNILQKPTCHGIVESVDEDLIKNILSGF